MSQHRPPPPPPECLVRRYPSSQKGGTVVAEDVLDPETHRQRLCDPDGYRPTLCPGCDHDRVHVHDYPERALRAEPGPSWIRIVRYICASCSAVWRILPLFLARRLWRSWPVVEHASAVDSEPAPPARLPPVPQRTIRRWSARLAAAALILTQVLATTGRESLQAVTQAVGLDATRREVVDAHARLMGSSPGRRLAELAALLHRLAPGLRLM